MPIESVFQTLQAYLGSYYVNDFNFLGRTYQVNLQAEPRSASARPDPQPVRAQRQRRHGARWARCWTCRRSTRRTRSCTTTSTRAADINGNTLPGVSSGEAIKKMEAAAKDTLSEQFGFEWTELTLQEKLAGNTALFIFPLCVLFVFLALSAQYESWSLPLAIILIVPMCLLSALVGVYLRNLRQQHLHADRLRRAGGSGLQERHPDRGVRPAAGRTRARTAWRRRWKPRGCGCGRF